MANRGLGTLTLDLILKMGGFEKGMDKAARHADKRMRDMERRAKAWGRNIGIAAAAIGGAAVAGLSLYIKNTMEAEKVQAQLAARLKSTGQAAGLTLDDLNKMADALQRVTTFDDEGIGEVQSMLLTFTRITGDTFKGATEAVLDLSVAMNQGLKESAIQVGKALNDPILGVTALRRVGIQLSKDQEELIRKLVETGDVAGAQKIILAELATQMGGSAVAARDTLGGALTGLKNTFDNLMEGDSGDAGVVGVRDAIEDLNKTLNDPGLKAGFDTLVSGALTAIGVLARFAMTTASTVKFLAEEVAARVHGPSMDDVVRVSDRIKRLQETMAAVKATGATSPMAIMDASELVPGDLLRTKDGILKRLQTELDKEQSKLKVGMELSEQSVAKAARIAAEAAAGIASPGVSLPSLPGVTGGGTPAHDARAAEAIRERILNTDALTASMMRQEDAELDLVRAKQDGIAATDQLIRDMEAELDLIGLTSVEREKAIALRYADAHATAEQIARIGELAEELHQAREAEMVINDIKAVFTDFAVNAASGFGSIGDAFEDMAERLKRIAIQLLAEKAIQALFSALFGQPGAGGAEAQGGLADLFGGDWGFADGGYTGAGGKHQPAGIVHAGEYVINADSTRKLGTGFLDRLNGYASGGYVGATAGLSAPMAGGGVKVEIINNTGAPVRQQEGRGPDGQMIKRIVIGELRSAIASGAVDDAAGLRWGVAAQGRRHG